MHVCVTFHLRIWSYFRVLYECASFFFDWDVQLYIDGELIGGLDVCLEMHEGGELAELA